MTDRATEDLMAAAAGGDADAQFDVGVKYLQGDGVQQDYAKAREWLEKAANQGHSRARYNIGSLHLNGLGVARDASQTLAWYERAFESADPELLFTMAQTVEAEQTTLNAWPFAVKCYKAAADAGHVKAQEVMGLRIFAGHGIEQNIELGAHYISQSARQGNPKALWLLAKIYEEGHLGEPNLPHAMYLYYCAALEGHPDAEKDGRALEAKMTPEQQEDAMGRISATLEKMKQCAEPQSVRAHPN
jgi:TPR repeat protein